MTRFSLTLHPASEGDALELIWSQDQSIHRAVIDVGRENDYRRLRQLGVASGKLDLFVVSHVDADHIAGVLPMLREGSPPFAPDEVWFNAYHHIVNARNRLNGLDDREALGVEQGEKLSDGIKAFGWQWNSRFGAGPVSVDSPLEAPLDFSGLKLTLLSPGDPQLARLIPKWESYLKKAALARNEPDEAPPTDIDDDRERLGGLSVETLAKVPFSQDTAIPNGTSIAFLAEWKGRRILLGADAYPGVIEASLKSMGYSAQNRLKIDLYKVSHHGSRGNTSPDLLRLIDCRHFAFSTNGTRHDHPDPETIARILVLDPDRPKRLYFNFRQEHSTAWDDADLMARWNYDCIFPEAGAAGGQEGVTIDINALPIP